MTARPIATADFCSTDLPLCALQRNSEFFSDFNLFINAKLILGGKFEKK